MIADLDFAAVTIIIELADAVTRAELMSVGSRGEPANHKWDPADEDIEPTRLTAEEQRLLGHLEGLNDQAMAQVLALYWLGREASFGASVDEETYFDLLDHARANLDHAPWYLTMKPGLAETLRAGMAVLGV